MNTNEKYGFHNFGGWIESIQEVACFGNKECIAQRELRRQQKEIDLEAQRKALESLDRPAPQAGTDNTLKIVAWSAGAVAIVITGIIIARKMRKK